MPGIFQILNTSKDALMAHQGAINVTGSNIANVNTPGYTRQRVIFSSLGSSEAGVAGVKIVDIQRMYDRLLETGIVEQRQNIGYSEARKSALDCVEVIFNESEGGGINELLNKFWNAWEDLSENPDGQVERLALVSISQSLSSTFRQYSNELLDIREDADGRIADAVLQVNECIADIASLNEEIVLVEAGGGITNDLRDRRMELLKGLSEIVDIQYYEDSDGAFNIFLANGKPLVEGQFTWELDVEENAANSNFYDVIFKDEPGVSLNSVITSGELGGLLEIRDTTAVDYMTRLDSLAASIISTINTQHAAGYDANGNIGGDFFVAATEAKDMYVSSNIVSDTNRIAASATVNGDGDNALAMGAIKDNSVTISGVSATFNNHYASLVGRVGRGVAAAESSLSHQTVIMAQMSNRREEASGVSIDEEMMNLMKYQLGYNAAGKLCTVASELLDTLINLI